MKVNVLDLKGKSTGQIELPEVFTQKIRADLIKRSFLAIQSSLRQVYGSDPNMPYESFPHFLREIEVIKSKE